jgi:hypothetical protein
LDRPLSATVQGQSSSGKSHGIEKVGSLFPPEEVIHATQITPQALFYMKPGGLVHKFVISGERSHLQGDEAAEATRALREMQSAGRLSKLMPVKEHGELVTVLIEQEGPIAYVDSTTLHKIFEEDANRSLLLHTDERSEQTAEIIKSLASNYGGARAAEPADRIVQRHHALQRMLSPKQVVIPFAGQMGRLFPTDRVEARRAFPHMMSMIQAITLLYQRQRAVDEQGRLIATADDYRLARHLLSGPMSRLLGGKITGPARRCCQRMRAWANDVFTTTDVIRRDKASDRAVRGWLWELADAGILELVDESHGRLPAKYRWGNVTVDEIDRNCPALPSVESVFPETDFRHSDNAQPTQNKVVTPEAAGFADNFRQ